MTQHIDTQKFDLMAKNAIVYDLLKNQRSDGVPVYLVLREWYSSTAHAQEYVIHHWSPEMGYYWGGYFYAASVDFAKAEYAKKLESLQ